VEPIVSGVGTLDKGVRLLELVEAHGPRSLAELVTGSGLSRATTHRLAVALEAHGLLRRAPDGRFALGLRLVGLGRAAADALPLAEAAGPALAALRDATGESAQLYVREGDRRVCVASLESPHGLRTIVAMGAALPLDRGSAGRVLREGAEGWVESRVSGWVESIEERERGVASVSAPVHGPGGEVVAAVSVSGPIERTTRSPGERYGDAVVGAARAIEARIAA
jgi:DNA-binding IclR family transcriptional regulator